MILPNNEKAIFVDTWAWVALANESDQWHEIAESLNIELILAGYVYITTNFILDECYTLIQTRLNKKAAIKFGEEIRSSIETGIVKLVHVSDKIEDEAWNLFKSHKDKDYSFTDCTSFIVMQKSGINEAFTGDIHFSQFGFTRLPS